ncbi:ATP-binding protein [Collimonas sp.]|uniref:ATP-binding protein n=1 Tax=Collimonas sp. TaxID=1963772 RepID=UPI002CFED443|nr:ATP-binding protein [Collimonas sp.]HWW05886.1 ATP-binding protein [Collimonas sp.]
MPPKQKQQPQSTTNWKPIGTVVGNTSTSSYTFILRSFQAKLGDIVATKLEAPGSAGKTSTVTVWGRIVCIDRFNPFFPAEAAQELADESIRFIDTVLSGSRDHLEAEVLILGATAENDTKGLQLSPLTYPVKPSADVFYPTADDVRRLLTGEEPEHHKLRIGSLIARQDVEVSLSAKHVVSRHLAILAMTGGGKTVAARRIIRELIDIGYPLIIFDPHGDYLGFYEKRNLFKGKTVQILYPKIRVREGNLGTIADLIDKMGRRLTDAQQQFYQYLVSATQVIDGEAAADYILRLIDFAGNIALKKKKEDIPDELQNTRSSTMNAAKRSLEFVYANLVQMEQNNERLRTQERFRAYEFKEMPDPSDAPDEIVSPNTVSIFYLAGYDHLNQSAIVSVVLEALFIHRSTLNGLIPPFQAVVEEAHNFIPSRVEGTDETPSLPTIRKVITEGRKFGTGLILISQRPSRLDETTLAQCNSFLVLRLVNPRDKSFVRSVMENLTESDANILQTFGPGQGIVSGQAVRFPLLVKVDYDDDLRSEAIGDEDFITEAIKWKPNTKRASNSSIVKQVFSATDAGSPSETKDIGKPRPNTKPKPKPKKQPGRRKGIVPEGYGK